MGTRTAKRAAKRELVKAAKKIIEKRKAFAESNLDLVISTAEMAVLSRKKPEAFENGGYVYLTVYPKLRLWLRRAWRKNLREDVRKILPPGLIVRVRVKWWGK